MPQETLKCYVGGFDWQTVVSATGGKIGFFGATPVTEVAGADQAAVTMGNTDDEIGVLTISDAPIQAEVRALRNRAEELADDVRALSTLVHAVRMALVKLIGHVDFRPTRGPRRVITGFAGAPSA
ncbi:MAG: hypothetical protein KJ072_07315 [Verrucomicrobia bacterium]|nr:hypothetical protein [Verrucomicrobiota bacterium]